VTGQLTFHNRQRRRRINTRWLKQTFTEFLQHWPTNHQTYELAVYFVSPAKSAELNQTWLDHQGPTDVITFDYAPANIIESARVPPATSSLIPHPSSFADCLHGEIFICVEQAVLQARQFRTTWQQELLRYIIHAILHLSGFDDLSPRARKKMKRHENRLLREFPNSGFSKPLPR
jgi:probable rRNA maturation factor